MVLERSYKDALQRPRSPRDVAALAAAADAARCALVRRRAHTQRRCFSTPLQHCCGLLQGCFSQDTGCDVFSSDDEQSLVVLGGTREERAVCDQCAKVISVCFFSDCVAWLCVAIAFRCVVTFEVFICSFIAKFARRDVSFDNCLCASASAQSEPVFADPAANHLRLIDPSFCDCRLALHRSYQHSCSG